MIDLIIFPYSGTGKEVLDCIHNNETVLFISDDNTNIGKKIHGVEIKTRSSIDLYPNAKIILVHGSAQNHLKRNNIIEGFNVPIDRFATIIHPSAIISKQAEIGKNVFISAGVIIGPNVIIEDHVIILAGSIIHHDSHVKKNSIICGNVLIAGNVIVNENCYIGASSSIKNNQSIGNNCLIGMGSIVLNSIDANQTCYGIPAKSKK